MISDDVIDELDFGEDGLIPAIAQDAETGEVRMLAYMNEQAFRETVKTGLAHYWSRSRQELWQKGETSGNVQHVQEIRTDCDQDAVLMLVTQEGVACHTGQRNCFFNRYEDGEWVEDDPLPQQSIGAVLGELQRIVRHRDRERPEDSYTASLLQNDEKPSEDKILEKLGEEFTELLLAAKNNTNDRLAEELSDFLYHLIVLLRTMDMELRDVAAVLDQRRRD